MFILMSLREGVYDDEAIYSILDCRAPRYAQRSQ